MEFTYALWLVALDINTNTCSQTWKEANKQNDYKLMVITITSAKKPIQIQMKIMATAVAIFDYFSILISNFFSIFLFFRWLRLTWIRNANAIGNICRFRWLDNVMSFPIGDTLTCLINLLHRQHFCIYIFL